MAGGLVAFFQYYLVGISYSVFSNYCLLNHTYIGPFLYLSST
jgi:hypothetical protein